MLPAGWYRLWNREAKQDQVKIKKIISSYFFHEREKLSEAQNNGRKCAKVRLIEVAETLNCQVACNTTGKPKNEKKVDLYRIDYNV